MEAELAQPPWQLAERREAELLCLARELHDSPVQYLYGVGFHLG
jgi:signal transduction histidine kinase